MTKPAFLTVVPGVVVSSANRRFLVTHLLDTNSVLARELETQVVERLRLDAIRPVADAVTSSDAGKLKPGTPDLEGLTEEDWRVAQYRFDAIRSLLKDASGTRAAVRAAAEAAKVSAATLYNWMRLYQDNQRLSALIPQRRGRRFGTKKLSAETEVVVASTIEETYLAVQQQRPQEVINMVAARCRNAGISAPHPNTIRNRLHALPRSLVLRRRGRRDLARNLFEPIRGSFPGADFPLAVVQIDHSEADLIVVEDRTRLPMGRPWVTLAIDVFSRMVVGSYISMDRPNAAAVGMCLSRAMLPKGEYLATLDVPGTWPVCGRMRRVHSDNAREFRGAMLERACREYGIDLDLRPGKTPHYGGHIERLMGTAAGEIRNLPGATFASPAQRGSYNSDGKAALTLGEFERHLTDFLVNVYHKRIHAGLGTPPMRQWEIGVLGDGLRKGTGLPDVPGDPERLRLDFLPFVERTVQPYGIVIDDVHYYDEVLNPWINAPDVKTTKLKRSFIIRRDPRDISQVHFFDPDANQYYAISYRDTSRPPISLWELRAARQRLKEEGKSHVDEQALFEAAERLRRRTGDAVAKTKAARRHQHQIDRLARRRIGGLDAPAAMASGSTSGHQAGVPAPGFQEENSAAAGWLKPDAVIEDDIFADPVLPFERAAMRGNDT